MTEPNTVWIKTAWISDPEGAPWMIASYDEFTFESWGTEPDFYTEDIAKHSGDHVVREMYIYVPVSAIDSLFVVPFVAGKAVPSD